MQLPEFLTRGKSGRQEQEANLGQYMYVCEREIEKKVTDKWYLHKLYLMDSFRIKLEAGCRLEKELLGQITEFPSSIKL